MSIGESQGNLGMVEASGASLPVTGVEYVLSTPSGRAVLRPLRYPLYDSEFVPNALSVCRNVFVDHQFFANGTLKDDCDRNITLSGTLGAPNLFDLVGFLIEIEYGVSQGNYNSIYNNVTFRWVFGLNTVFLRTSLKRLPQGVGPYGYNPTGTIVTQGLGLEKSFYNFTTPTRKARRIDETEQFRAELCPCGTIGITGGGASGIQIWVYMIGILYVNV